MTKFDLTRQTVVNLVGDRLEPFIAGTILHIFVIGEMLHPRVFSCSVPVLDSGRDGNHYSRLQFYSFLAPFLIPATTSDTYEHLHLLVVYMPVVAAAWLESDIEQSAPHVGQIAVTDKVLGVGNVWLAFGPTIKIYLLFFHIVFIRMFDFVGLTFARQSSSKLGSALA